jgi:hypothetical protein
LSLRDGFQLSALSFQPEKKWGRWLVRQAFFFVWALPWTCVGLAAGAAGLVSGGAVRRRGRTIEFHGGAVSWLLDRAPLCSGAAAMTWGHVILGQTAAALDVTREHELLHVRQYERWGPLFIPAYLVCSAVIWWRGGDAYRDNPFERQAYRLAP